MSARDGAPAVLARCRLYPKFIPRSLSLSHGARRKSRKMGCYSYAFYGYVQPSRPTLGLAFLLVIPTRSAAGDDDDCDDAAVVLKSPYANLSRAFGWLLRIIVHFSLVAYCCPVSGTFTLSLKGRITEKGSLHLCDRTGRAWEKGLGGERERWKLRYRDYDNRLRFRACSVPWEALRERIFGLWAFLLRLWFKIHDRGKADLLNSNCPEYVFLGNNDILWSFIFFSYERFQKSLES